MATFHAEAQPSQLRVPRVPRVDEPSASATHEVLLPADVVMRPGESPADALARALSGDDLEDVEPR